MDVNLTQMECYINERNNPLIPTFLSSLSTLTVAVRNSRQACISWHFTNSGLKICKWKSIVRHSGRLCSEKHLLSNREMKDGLLPERRSNDCLPSFHICTMDLHCQDLLMIEIMISLSQSEEFRQTNLPIVQKSTKSSTLLHSPSQNHMLQVEQPHKPHLAHNVPNSHLPHQIIEETRWQAQRRQQTTWLNAKIFERWTQSFLTLWWLLKLSSDWWTDEIDKTAY